VSGAAGGSAEQRCRNQEAGRTREEWGAQTEAQVVVMPSSFAVGEEVQKE
jgi:hypothetical protein